MSRLEIDKNSPLYNLIDVVIGEGTYKKKLTIAQLVDSYYELENLIWLKNELVFIAERINESISKKEG